MTEGHFRSGLRFYVFEATGHCVPVLKRIEPPQNRHSQKRPFVSIPDPRIYRQYLLGQISTQFQYYPKRREKDATAARNMATAVRAISNPATDSVRTWKRAAVCLMQYTAEITTTT